MKKLIVFLCLLFLCSFAYADVVMDGMLFSPCREECTDWVYRTPDEGIAYDKVNPGPKLDLLEFGFREGMYKITICGTGDGAGSDSIFVGVDGNIFAAITLKFWEQTPNCSSELQDGGQALISLSRGVHTVNLWAREDGLTVTDVRFEFIEMCFNCTDESGVAYE